MICNRFAIKPNQKLNQLLYYGFVFSLLFFSSLDFAAHHRPKASQPLPRTLTLKAVIESTLLLDPDILLEEEQQDVVLGEFLTQFGFFDTVFNWDIAATQDFYPLQQSAQGIVDPILGPIPGPDSLNTDSGLFNTGLSKTFQNGVSLNSNVNMTRQQTNINRILDIPIENRSFVNFSLNVPFFQGSAVGLTAKAAYLSFLAERYTYAHTISRTVLDSILAYWTCLESYQSYNFLETAVQQDKRLVVGIKEMVDKGEQTESDLTLAKANLESRQATYYAFREKYFQDKERLANLMGIHTENINLLPPPSTSFPKKRNMNFTQQELPKFFKNMMQFRNDLKAAILNVKANYALLRLQQTNLGPQFNGNASVGYRGLYEGTETTRSLSNNTKGPVATVGLTYAFPLQNNTARGNLMTQSAVYAQSKITYMNLLRTIKLSLITAFNSVKLFGLQALYSKNAEGNYSQTLSNELLKLKLGESSLIDVLRIKDLMVQSQLDAIRSQSGYSQALAQLYFEQGLFNCHDHMHCAIDLKPIS